MARTKQYKTDLISIRARQQDWMAKHLVATIPSEGPPTVTKDCGTTRYGY